jgi:alkylhydroperoxidase family enzyme
VFLGPSPGWCHALAPSDRALLHYGVNPTPSPREIEPAEIEHLESAGFDDQAIHDTSAIAADYAFVNRIADGLGVEFEQGAAFGGT